MNDFEVLKDFGCKRINHHYYGAVHIYHIYREKLRSDEGSTLGENTSKPFFRSVITGDLIIRIGGYDWSTLSSNLIGYQKYQELYQAC